jgi:Zn finger protein HypA/HybF involved in hydrogenase expression
MHEFSIAQSLCEQVRRHTPPGARVRRVTIEAGPLQGIDLESLQVAWGALADGTDLAGSVIEMVEQPWPLHCPACGRDFTSPVFPAICACGSDMCHPVGGRDLLLTGLAVDDPAEGAATPTPQDADKPSQEPP